MKLKVIKIYDVETPTVNQIVSYLKSIGYIKEIDAVQNMIGLMNPTTKTSLEIPSKEDFSDYERRLHELFDDISRIHDIDTLKVWSNIIDHEVEMV